MKDGLFDETLDGVMRLLIRHSPRGTEALLHQETLRNVYGRILLGAPLQDLPDADIEEAYTHVRLWTLPTCPSPEIKNSTAEIWPLDVALQAEHRRRARARRPIEAYRYAHLAGEARSVTDSLEALRKQLHSTDPKIAPLSLLLFTCRDFVLYTFFGEFLTTKQVPEWARFRTEPLHSPAALAEWIAHFISYHLRDDGDPGIGYWRYNHTQAQRNSHVLCAATAPGARPFLVQRVEWLRRRYPEAELCYANNTLDALRHVAQAYEEEHSVAGHRVLTMSPDDPEYDLAKHDYDNDVEALLRNDGERQRQAIAEQLLVTDTPLPRP